MEDNAYDWPAPEARLRASPLVRRIACERGLDLGAIEGSGPGGRIVERDLHRAGTSGGGTAGNAETPPSCSAQPVAEIALETASVDDGSNPETSRSGTSRERSRVGRRKQTMNEDRVSEVIVLRQRVSLVRLDVLREVIEESHGPVPLWAFAARALLRLGHEPLAVASGFGVPRRLRASATDPVTVLADRIGEPEAASCVLEDLAPEAFTGGVLPLPEGADIQVVLSMPHEGQSGREIEVSVAARPQCLAASEVAALLRALVDALEKPGPLLSSLPEV